MTYRLQDGVGSRNKSGMCGKNVNNRSPDSQSQYHFKCVGISDSECNMFCEVERGRFHGCAASAD